LVVPFELCGPREIQQKDSPVLAMFLLRICTRVLTVKRSMMRFLCMVIFCLVNLCVTGKDQKAMDLKLTYAYHKDLPVTLSIQIRILKTMPALFRGNLFHRKCVLSDLLKWKISSWNIFHRNIYSAYVKFVLASISRPTVKFVSEWTLQKQLLVSLLDKV
jgi:hypothetical protein